ncbi:MAG TPA: hypothetical protein VEX86_28575 [Longimicrobium sp.]|nr:hypothetical protein [Longimicrobium sp.]
MPTITQCPKAHWNVVHELWDASEWSRACCGTPTCRAPLDPTFTDAPRVATMPAGQLGRVVHTRFQKCPTGHCNASRRHLVRPVCGAPYCRRELQDVASWETFDSKTTFYAPREDVHEHAVRRAAAHVQEPKNKALMLVANFLATRDRARLPEVNKALKDVSRAAGYDPFGGAEVLGQGNGPLPLSGPLQDLAKHAFNHVYRVVRSNIGFGQPLRAGDQALREWSTKYLIGSKESPFIAGNCRACAVVAGNKTNAVNFTKYGNPSRDKLIQDLGLANQPALPLQRYDRTPNQHAEVRLAEAQDDQYERGEISVDKLCCLFCAVQIEALGRAGDIAGAKAGHLGWYVFSRYVMYFRTRREVMWGREVERGFTLLGPENRIQFLRILAGLAASHEFGGAREYDKLPTIETVIAQLR